MNEIELNFGAQMSCMDGKCGTLGKVALDPETLRVSDLIVEEGFLMKRARAFPFSALERATPEELRIAVRSDELENYPTYREETVEVPAPQQGEGGSSVAWREGMPYGAGPVAPLPVITEKVRYGVADELQVIDGRTVVEGLDNTIGKVDRLLVEQTSGRITQIVVQQGMLLSSKRALPIFMVSALSEDGIFVEASKADLEDLPEYEPGAQSTPRPTSDVGAVQETGATTAATTNEDLSTRVTRALFEDRRTSDAVIEVIDERGVITLDGEVDSPATREAAKEIAAAVPGVTTVVDVMRVAR